MAVKIRLQRRGRKAAPFYHIVAADSRSPRDGKFIEKLGTYNPLTVPATIELNRERANYWLGEGAQPTDTVNAILRFKGVLYQKHLQKGVAKGAFDQEKADEMLAQWIEQKEASVKARREETKEAKKSFVAHVDGTAKVKAKKIAPVVVEEAPASEEGEEAMAAETEVVIDAPAEAVAEVEQASEASVVEAADSQAEAVAEVEQASEASVVEAADSQAEPVAEAEAAAEEQEASAAAPPAEVETPAVEEAPTAEAVETGPEEKTEE